MVAIFTGLGAGFERSSANILGGAGQVGSSLLGRGGESVSVNAATGNLLITHQDEFLIGRGPDVGISRTYNSAQDTADGDNGDNWQQSTTRKVFGLTGTLNTAGSTISRLGADGAVIVYTWNAARSAYLSKDGDGAFDTLVKSGAEWVWTDGGSQQKEYYEVAVAASVHRIRSVQDGDANALTFTYVSSTDKLDKVTTADGSWTQYTWSGSAVATVVTGYTDLVTSTAKTLTRVRYAYDGSGRLSTVTTDLSPGDNSVADNNKYVTTYTYHGATTRVASVSQTDGSSLAITYDGSNRVATLTQTVASGVTRVTTLSYNTNYTTVTGPDSQVTRLDYDGSKRLTKITAPPAYSGATAQEVLFGYDGDGNVTSVTTLMPGTDLVTNYSHDANGNVASVTTVMPGTDLVVTRTYNAGNRLITEQIDGSDEGSANATHYSQYAYDSEGHLRFAVNASGQVTEYLYGTTGELTYTREYAEHPYSVGASAITESAMVTWRNGLGDLSSVKLTRFIYDARGNLTDQLKFGISSSTAGTSTAEGSSRIYYTYDQAGQLLARHRDGENTESFTYDGMGRLVSSTDKNGGTVTIVFTDATTTTAVTTALGLTTTSVFNKAGELISYAESGASTTAGTATYEYDLAGRLRVVTDATNRKSYFYYDKTGRKVAEVNQLGELTEYRYDAASRLVATIAYSTAITGTPLTNMGNPAYTGDLSAMLPSANAADIWSWNVYDDAGRVIQSIDNLGSTATFEYDNSSRLVKTTAWFNKLSSGTLTGFKSAFPTALTLPTTDAKDTVARVFYNKAGQLVGALDGEGFLSETVYDSAGFAIKAIAYATVTNSGDRASGSFTTLKSGVTGSPTTDRLSWSVYDGQGLLRYTVNAAGGVTGLTYDDAGRLTKTIAYATQLSLSDFTYDAVKAAVTTDAADRTSWIVYDAAGRAAYTVDAEGGVTAFTYDTSGQVIKAIAYDNLYASTVTLSALNSWAANSTQANDTANRLTRNWYNARGEVLYSIDAETYVAGYTYDEEGRVLSTISYGATGVTVSDSTTIGQLQTLLTGAPTTAAITVSQTYDNAGRVLTITDGEGVVTRSTYNALGQLYEADVAYGHADVVTTRYTYDGAGRALTATAAQGAAEAATVTYAYDGLGNQTSVTDALGHTTTFTHDRLGRVLTATDPLSGVTTYIYDAFGNVAKITSPGGDNAFNYYDNLNRLTLAVNGEKYITTIAYNRFSEVTSSSTYKTAFVGTPVVGTPPSTGGLGTVVVLTTVTYDRLGRVATKVDAEGYGESYAYNSFGQLVTFRRYPGTVGGGTYNETLFEYDNRGSLEKTTDAEAWVESYTYDAFGRRATSVAKNETIAKTASGTTIYEYYKNGLLKSATLPIQSYDNTGTGLGAIKTSYTYDKRGNLTQTKESDSLADQRITNYTYDKLNRKLTSAGETITNGVTIDDSTKALSTQSSAAPTETITYDLNGNVITIVDAAGAKTVFFYDQLNRKTVEINALGTYTVYTYDADGSVTNIKIYEVTVSVPANGGASSSAPAAPSGDKRETSFTYDGMNRMLTSSVVLPSGYKTGTWNGSAWTNASTATLDTAYQYDYLGNVVKIIDPNGNETFSYYDKLGRKTAQLDTEGYLTDWTYNSEGNVLIERRYNTQFTSTPTTASPPSVSTNAADRVTTYTYDKVGNRLSEARSSVVIHNGSGATSTVTSTISYAYNGLGQVVQKTEATGDQFGYAYDAGGRLRQETRPSFTSNNGASVTPTLDYFYDGLGNLVHSVAAGGGDATTARVTRYNYGVGGRLSETIDADGKSRFYLYDVAGRLVLEHFTRTITSTSGSTTTAAEGIGYRYDALGRSLGQAYYLKPSSTWNFQSGNEYSTIAYNSFGDVVSAATNRSISDIASKGWQMENKYDQAGRLWATNAGDGIWKYFGYDKNGNQTLAITSAGENMAGLSFATIFGKISESDVNGTYTVYDKRNLATSVIEEDRQLSLAVTQTLTSSRTYNAFGEAASETDKLNYTTTFSYNTMGRLIRKESPTVSITLEDGTSRYVKPSEDYYYDASGRLVATRDANGTYATGGTSTNGTSKAADTGSLNRLTLLAGTGYGGSEAQVTVETHADGGTVTNKYNIFGDLREVGRTTGTGAGTLTTAQTFDILGRLTAVTYAGGATLTYVYDELGRQVKNYNSVDGSGDAEITVFDIQGRVTGQRTIGGDLTTNAYAWDDTSTTDAIGVFGGWVRTVTGEGHTATYETDLFGRDADASKGYDYAGRLGFDGGANPGTTQDDFSLVYYNTGLLRNKYAHESTTTFVDPFGSTITYGGKNYSFTYDAMGRLKTDYTSDETLIWTPTYFPMFGITVPVGSLWVIEQKGEVEYDALGRLIRYRAGLVSAPDADKTWTYDAQGNIRSAATTYKAMQANGLLAGSTTSTTQWYRYDSMNRVVLSQGILSGGAIIASTTGVALTYDQADRRMTSKTGTAAQEDYTLNAQGLVTQVTISGIQRSTTSYDALGRINGYIEKDGSANVIYERFAFSYNSRGQVLHEKSRQKQGSDWYYAHTVNHYNDTGFVGGVTTAPGVITGSTSTGASSGMQLYYTRTKNWKNGTVVGGTGTPAYGGTNDNAAGDTSLSNETSFDEDLGWRQTGQTYVNKYGTGFSGWQYDGDGSLRVVERTETSTNAPYQDVYFLTDISGQVIRRWEQWDVGSPGGGPLPITITYRFGGKEMGLVTNNGNTNVDYATLIDRRDNAPGAGPFLGGAGTGTSHASFDANHITLANGAQGDTPGSWTVKAGDTLQTIAMTIWGDASQWYKIAQVNGMSDASGLSEGQILTIPGAIGNIHNNADTIKPYDPAKALGDVSPPAAKPPKQGGCGMFGQILSVIVAVVATQLFGAIPGNLISQGFNNLIGIQKGFSWKSLGMSVISAGVNAGVGQVAGAGAMLGSQIAGDVIRGAAASAITQGIGVATGLQEKFSWAGVAAAGVSSGALGAVTRGLNGGQGSHGADGSWNWNDPSFQPGFLTQAAAGAAASIANAATRSAITGESFGDALKAGLPDVIGQVLAGGLLGAMRSGGGGTKGSGNAKATPPENSAAAMGHAQADASVDPSVAQLGTNSRALGSPVADNGGATTGERLEQAADLGSLGTELSGLTADARAARLADIARSSNAAEPDSDTSLGGAVTETHGAIESMGFSGTSQWLGGLIAQASTNGVTLRNLSGFLGDHRILRDKDRVILGTLSDDDLIHNFITTANDTQLAYGSNILSQLAEIGNADAALLYAAALAENARRYEAYGRHADVETGKLVGVGLFLPAALGSGGALLVAAAPAVTTFALTNAARISAGSGVVGEIITGVPLTVPVATGSGVALLGVAERGVTFEGTLYRAVGSSYDPLLIHPGNIAASHRYSASGQGALYFGSGGKIVEAELKGNGSSLAGQTLYAFPSSSVSGLLDLTDPAVRQSLGVTLGDLTRTGGTKAWRYEVTQPLGAFAQNNGYSGIIAPSAQADGGVNLILFGSQGVE